MAKTSPKETQDTVGRDLGTECYIYCPGCETYHSLRTRMPKNPTPQEIEDQRLNRHGLWSFNGNTEKPTFSPSLLVAPDDPKRRCHSFITDGKIQFLGDCWHNLKNQTVDLPDIDL